MSGSGTTLPFPDARWPVAIEGKADLPVGRSNGLSFWPEPDHGVGSPGHLFLQSPASGGRKSRNSDEIS